jgi:hypothetical protein
MAISPAAARLQQREAARLAGRDLGIMRLPPGIEVTAPAPAVAATAAPWMAAISCADSPPPVFAVGDKIDVFSESKGLWVPGEVTAWGAQGVLEAQYGTPHQMRRKSVPVGSRGLHTIFRSRHDHITITAGARHLIFLDLDNWSVLLRAYPRLDELLPPRTILLGFAGAVRKPPVPPPPAHQLLRSCDAVRRSIRPGPRLSRSRLANLSCPALRNAWAHAIHAGQSWTAPQGTQDAMDRLYSAGKFYFQQVGG